MTEREIHRIRKKFIMISTLAFFGVMLVMGSCIYLFSTFALRNEVHQIMGYIVENDGQLPIPEPAAPAEVLSGSDVDAQAEAEAEVLSGSEADVQAEAEADVLSGSEVDAQAEVEAGAQAEAEADVLSGNEADTQAEAEAVEPGAQPPREDIDWSLRRIFGVGDITGETADSLYSTRYFAVLFDKQGEIEEVITSHIASISESTAKHYAEFVLHSPRHFDSFGRYYYHVDERKNGGKIVIYVDRSAQLTAILRIVFIALALLVIGTLLAYHFMRIFSKDIVRSEVENVERQKQFITNASHELKTPLAVIRANTEMQEMLEGETEWTQSTMRQVDRLNGLVQNLVQIARAQETATGELTVMNIAPAVLDTAESFIPVAAGDGKTLLHKISANVSMEADESMIRQLVSLLVDNAVKYCDPDGVIRVVLVRSVRTVILTVSNMYADGASVDYTRFFERFYRQDGARTISEESTPESLSSPASGDVSSGGAASAGNESGSYAPKEKTGYGIGLSIVDELVKALHGTIHVSWKNGVISFICRFRSAS